jgi:biofilm protein TabA
MKKLMICRNLLLILCFSVVSNFVFAQQQDTNWTAKKANKWFKKNEWSAGTGLKAHPSTNKVEMARQYQKNKAAWDKAFAFISEHKLEDLAPGKYPIDDDNVYATITEAPSKEFDKSMWESHRKYIDLQYVIKGQEKIGVAPVAKATVTKPYDESKDSQNYSTEGKYYIAKPGTYFLFFPQDAHRPNIKVEGYDVVKKLVIKIRVV